MASFTQRFNDRLNGLARQIVALPSVGAKWDWPKIPPYARHEVAYEALLVAVEELGVEAPNGDLLYKARWRLPDAAREWRKVHQNAPLNKDQTRPELDEDELGEQAEYESAETAQSVRDTLAKLDPEDAALLQAMMQYENPTEAAQALKMPRQTFVDRLGKAKRRFAELYGA